MCVNASAEKDLERKLSNGAKTISCVKERSDAICAPAAAQTCNLLKVSTLSVLFVC